MIGGIAVGLFSGSEISVSGPVAALAVIVADAITKVGSYAAFLAAVFLGVALLNRIPLSCLAAVLIMVGYKLAKPAIFKKTYRDGWDQPQFKEALGSLEPGDTVLVNGSKAPFIDHDIYNMLYDYQETAKVQGIPYELQEVRLNRRNRKATT